MMWFVRHAEAMDGLTYQTGKVGLKDVFDYGDNHNANQRGETIVEPNFALNGNAVWESNVLPSIYYRKTQPWQNFNNVPERNIYVFSFTPMAMDAQTYTTVNYSKVDTKQFHFYHRTNNATSGTGFFFAYNVNLMVTNNSQSVIPFAS